MHKLLCKVGIHTYGSFYHKDQKRNVKVEFPRNKEFEITDERIFVRCLVCNKEKLIVSIDNPFR